MPGGFFSTACLWYHPSSSGTQRFPASHRSNGHCLSWRSLPTGQSFPICCQQSHFTSNAAINSFLPQSWPRVRLLALASCPATHHRHHASIHAVPLACSCCSLCSLSPSFSWSPNSPLPERPNQDSHFQWPLSDQPRPSELPPHTYRMPYYISPWNCCMAALCSLYIMSMCLAWF